MGIWSFMGRTSIFVFGLGFYTHAALFSNSDKQMLKTQLECLNETVKAQIDYFKQPSRAQMAKYREIEMQFDSKYRELEKKLDYLLKLSTAQNTERETLQ